MIKNVPSGPGIYMFKGGGGEIIYIGKSKDLRKRVASYFKGDKDAKTNLLVQKIKDAEFFLVNNEVEALILENTMIKKHKPKYNINLRDSKTFAYISITDEKFPRIFSTRMKKGKGQFFGPYTDASIRDELVQVAVKSFHIRTCDKLPKKACLNFHIGLCKAPCINNINQEEYAKDVQGAVKFLSGDIAEIREKIEKEMKEASGKMHYELAAEKKRQLDTLRDMGNQDVEKFRDFDQDVIAMVCGPENVVFEIFYIKRGVINGKKEFIVKPVFEQSDDEVFENFVKSYYSSNEIPDEIIVNRKFWGNFDSIEKFLEKISSRKTKIIQPRTQDDANIMALAEKNASLKVENRNLQEIQKALNMPSLPRTIECIDISNLGYDHVVGTMTRFVDGQKDRSGYRKFEIRSFKGKNDDFAAIAEVVQRRYGRLSKEQNRMPNLIIIDGGAGQLNAALAELKLLGLQIPIISLAKKEEEIYLPENAEPLRLDKNSPMMLLIRAIRDETHRFSLNYNRKKREMRLREETRPKS